MAAELSQRKVCRACGLSGLIGFVETREGVYCERCFPHARKRLPAGHFLALLTLSLFSVGLAMSSGGRPDQMLVDLAAFTAVFLAATAVAVAVHEAGHALAGALLGFSVFGVVIGNGPRIIHVSTPRFGFELRLLPFGGATLVATPRPGLLRLRTILVMLAGPVASGACAVFAYTLLLAHRDSAFGFAWALGFNSVMGFVANLVPYRFATERGVLATDGLQIVRALRMGEKEKAEMLTAYEDMRVMRHVEHLGGDRTAIIDATAAIARDGGPAIGVLSHVSALCGEYRYLEAADLCRRQLADPAFDAVARLDLLNCLAWANVMTGDPTLLAEADASSEEALAAMPLSAPFQGTRAAVLNALGRPAEALPLLEQSIEGLRQPRYRRLAGYETFVAENQAQLALTRVRLGDLFGARQALVRARRGDPRFPLLQAAEREVAQADVEHLAALERDATSVPPPR